MRTLSNMQAYFVLSSSASHIYNEYLRVFDNMRINKSLNLNLHCVLSLSKWTLFNPE